MTATGADDLARRVERLADLIAAERDFTDGVWREAFLAVPRHLFIPDAAWASPNKAGQDYRIDRAANPEEWLDAVYSDTIVITQFDDESAVVPDGKGEATSSNSAPGAVLTFLHALQMRDHHRVLEIGTGTGWTAALLSHRVGSRNVITVEVDKALADQADANLRAAGYCPRIVVGDGAIGWAAGAPYDRVHVTCSVNQIPYAWIEQTRPGGIIVVPYRSGYGYGFLAQLTVAADGSAVGQFVRRVGFMMLRSQRPASGPVRSFLHHKEDVERSTTSLDPRTVVFDSDATSLAIGARVPHIQRRMIGAEDGSGEYTLWLFETTGHRGSWASVDYEPGKVEFEVEQYGNRRLWDEVTEAYMWWVSEGRPEWERFGLRVTPDEQYVWLDRPSNPVSEA